MNYLIVDDEPQARKLLQAYMASVGSGYNLIKVCSSAMEAYEALHAAHIDFMFLDIKMPIVSGVDFLRSLKKPPLVIFTTAYQKFAMEGYELNVVDYLLKPIALPRLIQALEKVNGRLSASTPISQRPPEQIFIKQDNKLIRLALKDILLIESMQNYVKIHLEHRVLVLAYTMKAIQDMLPSDMFLRVHRSYIVPVRLINTINGNIIETTYLNVSIGATYRDEVISHLRLPK